MPQPLFDTYIGIDYSGAKNALAPLTGIRVFMALADGPVREVLPPKGKYWSRKSVAEWIDGVLCNENSRYCIGIDHGFSVPLAYYDMFSLPHDWHVFLDHFSAAWPLCDALTVDDIRRKFPERAGNSRWRRLADISAGSAKSVFHFDVQGSVAKSTHTGIPWLKYLRDRHIGRLHFWPFDGFAPSRRMSVIAEVYPRIWRNDVRLNPRHTPDQQDAYAIAKSLQSQDRAGRIVEWLKPEMSEKIAKIAGAEGWILGVTTPVSTSYSG